MARTETKAIKRVYTADNAAIAWNIKHVLDGEGMAAEVRNDQLYSVAGEVPVFEVMPEVWLNDESDEVRALAIIKKLIAKGEAAEQEEWQCSDCQEFQSAAFEVCWKCASAEIEAAQTEPTEPLSANDKGSIFEA